MNIKNIGNQKNIINLVILAITLSYALIGVKFLITAFSNLRPIADDYCNATAANINIFSNLKYWFETWSGDVFQILISYVFVGFPALHLPIGVGSALTFLSAITFLTAVSYNTFVPINTEKISTFKKFHLSFFIFITTLTSWVVYWWLPVFFANDLDGSKNLSEQFLITILSWQTVNGPYVVQSAISFLIVSYFLERKFDNLKLIYPIIFGLMIGTSGYVLALSLTLLVILETVASFQLMNLNFFKKNLDRIFLVFFSFIGTQISANSAGAKYRKTFFPQNPDIGSIFSVATTGIKSWFDLLISPSTLYLLIVGMFLFSAFSHIAKIKIRNLNRNSYRFLFMSFSTLLLSKISEIFSYVAFWHSIFSQVFLYLALVSFGASLKQYLSSKQFKLNFLMSVTALGCITLISVYGLSQAELRIENRKAQWEVGPASAPNGQPADREIPWINDCWLEFQKLQNNLGIMKR